MLVVRSCATCSILENKESCKVLLPPTGAKRVTITSETEERSEDNGSLVTEYTVALN